MSSLRPPITQVTQYHYLQQLYICLSSESMESSNNAGAANEAIDPASEQQWVDITSLVEQCASSLSYSNPMLCTDNFSLQDSMAAMELMDSKMDSCEIPASHITGSPSNSNSQNNDSTEGKHDKTLYPRPPPKDLNDDVSPLPWDDLSIRDAAFIGVEAMVRLESMLGGSSVVESTYTCLYAHCPVMQDMKTRLDPPEQTLSEKFEKLLNSSNEAVRGSPAQHVVYATSLALVEITEITRSIVLHGDIYEEEDFCANTYNIPVFSDREKGITLSELTYALKLVKEIGKKQQESDEVQAVLLILGFWIDFLNVTSAVVSIMCQVRSWLFRGPTTCRKHDKVFAMC